MHYTVAVGFRVNNQLSRVEVNADDSPLHLRRIKTEKQHTENMGRYETYVLGGWSTTSTACKVCIAGLTVGVVAHPERNVLFSWSR